jgi:hypothetical protein
MAAMVCREMKRMFTNRELTPPSVAFPPRHQQPTDDANTIPPNFAYKLLRERNVQQNHDYLKALGLLPVQTSPKKKKKKERRVQPPTEKRVQPKRNEGVPCTPISQLITDANGGVPRAPLSEMTMAQDGRILGDSGYFWTI